MSDDLGFTPAAAIRTAVFGSSVPAAPQAAAPATPSAAPIAPTAAPLVDHHSDSGLSPEAVKMATWAREDLASGKITQTQADQIFDQLGVPLDQRTASLDGTMSNA